MSSSDYEQEAEARRVDCAATLTGGDAGIPGSTSMAKLAAVATKLLAIFAGFALVLFGCNGDSGGGMQSTIRRKVDEYAEAVRLTLAVELTNPDKNYDFPRSNMGTGTGQVADSKKPAGEPAGFLALPSQPVRAPEGIRTPDLLIRSYPEDERYTREHLPWSA